VDLQDEINGLLDDICGELFEQTEDEKEEIKEEIKTKYADLLLYTRELLDHDLVRDEDRSVLRYVAQSIERRTRFEPVVQHIKSIQQVVVMIMSGICTGVEK
jgi:hypothetical protein